MLTVTHNAPLKPLNTMGIDGTAYALVAWHDVSDLNDFFTRPEYESLSRMPVKAIGGGSNLLFTVYHYDSVLLKCDNADISEIDRDHTSVTLRVGAGAVLDDVIAWACDRSLWGAENLSLIPGTIGGAAVQNVGAYGAEFGQLVVAVHCYDRSNNGELTLGHDELQYGYRDSLFKHSPYSSSLIVTAVDIKLNIAGEPSLTYGNLASKLSAMNLTPAAIRDVIIRTRNEKLPIVGITGSAGSFFKNPVVTEQEYRQVLATASRLGISTEKMPAFPVKDASGEQAYKLSAAWLIDKSGWKGVRRWNVGTWPQQPLVIVNTTGYASGLEVTALVTDIINDIYARWGITLVPEVVYLS